MESKLKWIIIGIVILIIGIGFKLFFLDHMKHGGHDGHESHRHQAHDGHWTCSMHPQIMKKGPGKCPICAMNLVPVEPAEEKKAKAKTDRKIKSQIKLSKTAQMLASIQTAPVVREFGTLRMRFVGKVMPDETRQRVITARVAGRLDTLWVNFTGQFISNGSPMVEIYSPELLVAQKELLAAQKSGNKTLLRSVKKKLRLLELSETQIERILESGTARDRLILEAPLTGIVTKMKVVEGQYVKTGAPLFTVADLSRLWVQLDAYESDLSKVKVGQTVRFTTPSFPGKTFKGTVSFIDPVINPMTRTAMVRIAVPNADGKLKPEMLADAAVFAQVGVDSQILPPGQHPSHLKPLLIPASAPLITGQRAVVYVANPDNPGMFEGREVVLGLKVGEFYIVQEGLQEGEQVVTKGNFKIDSAMQIRAKPSMMKRHHEGYH